VAALDCDCCVRLFGTFRRQPFGAYMARDVRVFGTGELGHSRFDVARISGLR